MTKRVVLTGIGPVTAAGIGKEQFLRGLLEGANLAQKIPKRFKDRYDFNSKYYVPFPQFSGQDYGILSTFDRMLQNEDRVGILGTKLALEDANLDLRKSEKSFEVCNFKDACVIIGIGTSGMENALSSYLAHMGLEHPVTGQNRYRKMIIPMMMPNSVAAWITIFFGQHGGSYTVNASCASGTSAIGAAFTRISQGLNTVAITGGVEALTEEDGAIMRGYDTLGTLTRNENGLPMPFSKDRSGFLFSEGGGCILILEEMEHALKRKAPIYAEIKDHVDSSDAHNIVQIDKSGKQIEYVLKRLSKGKEINYLNAHGTGTVLSDEIEKNAICNVFGDKSKQPFINSTKGLLGHTLGASGAIETAVTAIAIAHSVIHGNASKNVMPELNLAEQNMNTKVDTGITVSYGFGGHNSGLLLQRFVL